MSDLYLEVNLHNLYQNLSKIKKLLHKDTMLMAVVKSNAYGHGSIEVSKSLSRQIDYLGTGLLEEAVVLRNERIELPILLMGPTDDYHRACINKITVSISSIEQLKALDIYANKSQKTVKIHLKVETGMNRFGINYNELDEVVVICKKNTNIDLEGVYSHFSTTYKNNKKIVLEQNERFDTFVTYFKEKYDNLIYHIANSENAIDFPNSHYNLVRVGNGLYGPCNSKKRVGLKKVAKIRARVIYKKHVKAKEYIGYGNSYKAKKNMDIGIISFGFYDGLGLFKKPIGLNFLHFILFYLKEIYRYLFKDTNLIYYERKPLRILGRPNMQFTSIDIKDISDKDNNLFVDIHISPIFIKDSIQRRYIAEVKN